MFNPPNPDTFFRPKGVLIPIISTVSLSRSPQSSETFTIPPSSREERGCFFARTLLVKPQLPPLNPLGRDRGRRLLLEDDYCCYMYMNLYLMLLVLLLLVTIG